MKYEVKFTNQFKKDLKLAKKQSRNLDKLFDAVNILADGGVLDAMSDAEPNANLIHSYEQSLHGEGRPFTEVFDKLEKNFK